MARPTSVDDWDLARLLARARNPDGTVYTLPVTTAPAELAGMGRAFLVGSGRMSLSVAGNVRGLVENPVGAGVTSIVVGISVFGTGVAWSTVFLNPTTGVPTTPNRPHLNGIIGGGYPRQTIMRVDTSATEALSGTETGIVIGSGSGNRAEPDLAFPLVMQPGVSLGINVPFAGAADASFNLEIVEVPA